MTIEVTSEPPRTRPLIKMLRDGSAVGETYRVKGPVSERGNSLQIVLEGGVLRQRFLPDGRRHTIAVYYRDDVINLWRYANGEQSGDYLLALKGTVLGSVSDDAVALMRTQVRSGVDGMTALVFRELGIAQERLTSLGQRSAVEAMAHFFCETLHRCADPLGNAVTDRCTLAITQDLLSTVLGLSSVHVNRTLKDLRTRSLADVVNNELVVHDYERLADLAGFDMGYLART